MHDLLLRVGAAAAVLVFSACATSEAAPVTFAFEAMVDSVSTGASFNSEIDLEEGDVITGQFTFEPNTGDGSPSLVVDQPYNFTVNINGVDISTADYEAIVRDDAGVIVDCVDLSCPSILDILELEGSSLSVANNTMLMNLDSESSGFRMRLLASADPNIFEGSFENLVPIPLEVVLDAAEIPADVEIWNSFSGRSLQVWLVDDQGGAFSLNATVGQFTVVPEPTSGSLVFLGLIAVGLAARTGRGGKRCQGGKKVSSTVSRR